LAEITSFGKLFHKSTTAEPTTGNNPPLVNKLPSISQGILMTSLRYDEAFNDNFALQIY